MILILLFFFYWYFWVPGTRCFSIGFFPTPRAPLMDCISTWASSWIPFSSFSSKWLMIKLLMWWNVNVLIPLLIYCKGEIINPHHTHIIFSYQSPQSILLPACCGLDSWTSLLHTCLLYYGFVDRGNLGTHVYPQGSEFPEKALLAVNCLTHRSGHPFGTFCSRWLKHHTWSGGRGIASFQIGKDLFGPAENCSWRLGEPFHRRHVFEMCNQYRIAVAHNL